MCNESIFKQIIEKFKLEPRIFYNEAQFQFDLAWAIKEKNENFDIKLEPYNDKIGYTDIIVNDGNKKIAIELKYKLADVETEYVINNCTITLHKQGAVDEGCYDYCKDLQRIEELVNKNIVSEGYAIIIANHPGYWGKSVNKKELKGETPWESFRLNDQKELNGELMWNGNATSASRKENIVLSGSYKVKWDPYLEHDKYPFKYMIVQIPRKK